MSCTGCCLPAIHIRSLGVRGVVVLVVVVVGVVVVAVVTLEKKYSKFIFQKLYILCVQCLS